MQTGKVRFGKSKTHPSKVLSDRIAVISSDAKSKCHRRHGLQFLFNKR